MTIWDYKITTPFGYVAGYPLNNGFHNGIDYGCPVGTQVTVNGNVIGLSGNTGYSSGPHCHVGRWVGGIVTNPGIGGGRTIAGAKVTQVSEDATNGKFVRIADADGSSWVFLHLSKQSVTVGQTLTPQGGNMPTLLNYDQVDSMAHAYLNDSIANNAGLKAYIGKPAEEVIAVFNGAPQRAAFLKHIADLEKEAVPLKPGKYIVN